MRFAFFRFFIKSIVLYLALLISGYCVAQDLRKDSINELSYGDMYTIYMNDASRYTNEIFDAHVTKAKIEKDTLELAKAYRYYAWALNITEGLKYVDSAITIVDNINDLTKTEYDNFKALTYYTKAAISYSNSFDEQATSMFIKSFHLAKKVNNKILMAYSLSNLSILKAEFGQENEAVLLQRKTLDFVRSNRKSIEIDEYYSTYGYCLQDMTLCYLYAKKTDSARYYLNKVIDISTTIQQSPEISDLMVIAAQADYYDGNILKAKDTLTKYLHEYNDVSRADKLYYLGMIAGKLENSEEKKAHFQSFDSIMREKGYPLLDNVNYVYQYLLEDAMEQNEKVLEKTYFKRLVYYDSLLLRTQERLREITLQELDLPLQEEEQQTILKALSLKNRRLLVFYIVCGLLGIGFLIYFIRYQISKKRLKYLMATPVQLKNYPKAQQKINETTVGNDTLRNVLHKLTHWEKEKGFLDSRINQQHLAKVLNTNSSYLSQTINTYKGQNFSSYLRDIRITYAINHLKENPDTAKNKSTIQLAELYGFSSLTVFTKAVKDKTGVTAGVFLKEIREGSLNF